MKRLFFADVPLSVSLLLTLAIASTEVPVWASLFSFVFILWRFVYEKRDIFKLSPKITPIFGLMFFVVVYVQHKTIFGQEESITILVGLTSITILNYASERDHLFMVLLGFLMLVLKSVFSIDFIWILPALISYFGLWVSLITSTNVNRYRYVFKTFLRSVPTLVVLFVLFPRFVLFQLEKTRPSSVAQSGFTEELTPGQFSQIALSDQMVFRAQFANGAALDSTRLYWRGAVLTTSNGFAWIRGPTNRKNTFVVHPSVNPIQYKVLMEPGPARNVFLLDRPVKVANMSLPILEREFSTYLLMTPSDKTIQYDGVSDFTELNEAEADDSTELSRYLQVPALPPRTTAWINDIKSKYSSDQDRLRQLIAFFEKPGFQYSLSPDYYGTNMDDFLFVRKKGFCEHYAAAFGSMARALGIPARVVIGYQGGVYNSYSQFWKISQKDAHAWVEVGLDRQWKRIDPTGLVTPLRISLGGDEYFSLTEDERQMYAKSMKVTQKSHWRSLYLSFMTLVDSLNYNWTMFLLNYDMEAQLEILKSLKFSQAYIFFGLFGLVLVFMYWRGRLKKDAHEHHALYSVMQDIENWAQSRNLPIKTSQTPLQTLHLIQESYPALRSFLAELEADYDRLVYQEQKISVHSAQYKKRFKQLIKNI